MGKDKMGKKVVKRKKEVWEWIVLGILVIGACLLRVVGQLDKVFVGDNVWFRGVDSWYHMRLADVVNFPNWIDWDMFAQFPNGVSVGYMPLLAWISVNDIVAAWLPPILGALVLIPVYFIGKELFSRRIGLLAGGLVGVLPGEFLHRSLLGFTDHHFLETLFMASTTLFLILAYKRFEWKWSILAGVSLGLYHLTWTGVAVFLGIVGVWVLWEFFASRRSLIKEVSVPIGIGMVISIGFISKEALIASMGVGLLPVGLYVLGRYIREWKWQTGIVGGCILVGVWGLVKYYNLVGFIWGSQSYIQEASPLVPWVMMATYGISFFLVPLGLWFCFREGVHRSGEGRLFLVWSIVWIVLAIGQRRWGYYTVIPVGLLSSFFIFYCLKWFATNSHFAISFVLILFLLIPSTSNIARLATLPNNISADWYVALTWMERNTSNPFPDENAYYSIKSREKAEYGVLSWWDYGHWIIRIAKRVPLTSPTQYSYIPAKFYTAYSEEEANEELSGLNIQYVIIDRSLLEGKWYAVVRRSEREEVDKKESMLYRMWVEEPLKEWTKVYGRGDIKVYERR